MWEGSGTFNAQMLSPLLFGTIEHDKAISYANVSSLALLVYDFFQTLDVEIYYVRHSPWTVIKRAYLCMRCLQFIYMSLLLLDDQWSALSDSACLGLKIVYWGLAALSYDASEAILTLRTWILCGKQRWVAKMLMTFNFILHIVGVVIMSVTFAFTTFDDIDIASQPWDDCLLKSSFNKLWVLWMLLVIYDAALCTLLASWAYNECKAKRTSPSVVRIYQEAIMYYLCIFVLDLAGLLAIAIHQDELFLSLSLPLTVRQLLTARVVFYSWKKAHLRSDREQYAYALTTFNN